MTRIRLRSADQEWDTETTAGESWSAAARRIAAPAVPVAGDLSGEPKRFVVDGDPRITLRPMTHGDLRDVQRWRQAEHVQRWFGPAPSRQEIIDRYAPRIDGSEPTRMSVVEAMGRSVGFIQDYLIKDHPGYALLTPDPEAIGGDYLIGEPAWLGRGFGTKLLWIWLTGLPTAYGEGRTVFVSPDHRNGASLRILAKAGFEQGIWFDEPQRDGSVATLIGCHLDLAVVVGRGA
ncbi:hypothetical protein GCM10011492_34100 [Flexivirga endophytica]|uniref:N-acetyltransferase domain-containing protein n=1 Tax=Flexivirga endophytica TaxID=1849103 RepID=A0A916WYY5_9MICO|nr:GNAT family N-acetyltransferase [Flexivirga endophytica]GGB40467.1 hypothetical protein GCM10011492_34100 [Flexivirga endophytica]GHB48298.1 hypothetical protein GCM10008112_16490 [Flexivirga endophytica]